MINLNESQKHMKSNIYKCIEFLIIFILIPISFTFDYLAQVKFGIGLLGFSYIIFILLKVEGNVIKLSEAIDWIFFCKQTAFKFVVIALITSLFVWLTNKALLFNVVLNKPDLWFVILLIYSFLSVFPQELIYRTFFFQRYKNLFINESLFIFINAIVFSLGHIFFKNTLVLILTFLGGLLFAITYNRTKSTLLVSIEHAIYGCWLFTLGMGNMLGFPS